MSVWTEVRWSPILALVVGLGVQVPQIRAQEATVGPDPKEIPVPRIKTSVGTLPGVKELPVRAGMPDVMVMNDGTKVTTREQWQKRRAEIRRILQYYAVGQMPPAPGNVKGKVVLSEKALDGAVQYRLVRLTFGPGEKLGFDVGIFTPVAGGPHPAVIMMSFTPPGGKVLPRYPTGPLEGHRQDVLLAVSPAPPVETPVATEDGPRRDFFGGIVTTDSTAKQYAEMFRRGYAVVLFNYTDCGDDTTLRNPDGSWAFRNSRFFPAYPGYDWSLLASWAWGSSRIADYLVTDPAIDKTKLIVSGGSRCGKATMVAAAFDDRLMGAPIVTGGGGMGAYRFTGARNSETLDDMLKKYPNWFSANLHEFWGHKEKLPFDQHWFLALAAPRPFLALEGDTDTISLPEAVRQSILGAQPAYELFGVKERLGVHYSSHGHTVTAEDWTAMADFFDKYARGKKIDATFDRFPTEAELDAAAAKEAAARKAAQGKK